jgi:hypothetical protein
MNGRENRLFINELARSVSFKLPRSYDADFVFWDRRISSRFRVRSVEPDLLVHIARDIKILVEIKWGAPLSPGELAAQWDSLSSDEQSQSCHLLIVRNRKQYQLDIKKDRKSLRKTAKSKWTLHQLLWRDLADILRGMSIENRYPANVRNWARLSSSFLSREEFRVLEDWPSFSFHPVTKLRWRWAYWPRLSPIRKMAKFLASARGDFL